MSRYEKKLRDKMDDEIKLAGLGALVLEELEKHLILNSNPLRTFEDARLEIVTFVEAKFGLRIRDSKPSDTGLREHSDPMDVGEVNSRQVTEKGHQVRAMGVKKCGGTHFQRDCNASENTGKPSSGKGKQSKSWSTSEDKGKINQNNGKSKGQSKGSTGAKGSCKGKTSKTGISGLENVKSETSSETQGSAHMGHVCATDTWIHGEWGPDEWNDGWSLDEWNDEWSSVGWHEDCEQTCDASVSSFSIESFDIGDQSGPKRFECVKMNLDTGAAVDTFQV